MLKKNNFLSFKIRKVHSLLGVIPLGFFLCEHLMANLTALLGQEAFQETVEFLEGIPGLWVLEVFLIAIPLLFHSIMGMIIALQSRNNPKKYSYLRNWMFFFQRVSGLVLFFFVIYHLYTVKFSYTTGLSFYEILHNQLTNPLIFTWYSLSITAAAFHFCNGLWGFAINWGIVTGPKSQKTFSTITIGLFIIFNTLWYKAMFAFI